MKTLIFALLVYTVTMVWFGMWAQKISDTQQIKAFEEAAFTDGCRKCAQFERLQCQRDQVQGQEGFTQIP